MRLRVKTDHFTTVLIAALGLAPLGACGGTFATNATDGGAGSGGNTSVGVGGDITPGTGGTVVSVTGGYDGSGGHGGTQGGALSFPCRPAFGGDGVGGQCGFGGAPGTYSRCLNGMIHRPAKVDCPSLVPRPIECAPYVADASVPKACLHDTDCTEKPHGYCGYAGLSTICIYGCVNDEECGTSQICVCGPVVGHCESASCSVDSQCGPGLVCGTYNPNPGCPGEAYACQTSLDQCAVDSDCTPPNHCTVEQGHRVCSPIMCVAARDQ